MKKTLLGLFTLAVLILISGCSINIERDKNTVSQQQLSGLEQRIKDLETENETLKNKATTTQPKKTTISKPKEMDNCPNGDKTMSRYDGICEVCNPGGEYKNGECVYYSA